MQSQLATIEVVTAEGEASSYLAPAGHQLLPLDGLGLVAVPKGPTGGTLIAGSEGFEPLSDHRVLTANETAMLEQACSTPIDCSLVVSDLASGEQWDVPNDFGRLGDTYRLSPDGMSLLRMTPEGYANFVSSERAVLWVIGSGMEAPVWDPGSTFIAWLDFVGEPKLKLMFVDEPDWLTIDLVDLGAPRPTGPELIAIGTPPEVAPAS